MRLRKTYSTADMPGKLDRNDLSGSYQDLKLKLQVIPVCRVVANLDLKRSSANESEKKVTRAFCEPDRAGSISMFQLLLVAAGLKFANFTCYCSSARTQW